MQRKNTPVLWSARRQRGVYGVRKSANPVTKKPIGQSAQLVTIALLPVWETSKPSGSISLRHKQAYFSSAVNSSSLRLGIT